MFFEADAWESTVSFGAQTPISLGGTFELAFADGVNLASQIGRTFDLFDWTCVNPTGSFTVFSPYNWNLANPYATGELTLLAVPGLPGDHSGDGTVDAAKYVVWRKGLGTIYTQDDYNDWQANFGTLVGSGAGDRGSDHAISPIVPEPATVLLLVFGAAVMCFPARQFGAELQ